MKLYITAISGSFGKKIFYLGHNRFRERFPKSELKDDQDLPLWLEGISIE